MKPKKAVATYIIPILFFFYIPVQAQVITTIAGTGTNGYTGDGGAALVAELNQPVDLCMDNAGNIYFTDFGNQRIRKIDTKGIITTIAGNGTTGFSGDGGPAINAQLNHPFRICTDNEGNLYFSDYDNFRVRQINLTSGIINTIGGNGSQTYVEGGQAINSGMLPDGLVLDGKGNLYVTQHNPPLLNNTFNIISKINLSTGIISRVAGNFISGFSGDGGPALNASLSNPAGISMDASGNLILADQDNNRIRKIDLSTGIISTIVGNGGTNYFSTTSMPALQGSFSNLTDVFVDNSGNLIACDENRLHIFSVNMSTGMVVAIAGNGYLGLGSDCVDPLSVPLGDCPSAITDAAGNLYIVDLVFGRIRKVINVNSAFPSVQISAINNDTCKGTAMHFSAQPSNVFASTSFQWMVNGQPVGTDTSVFSSSSLSNGDMVSCLMITQPAFLCDSVHHSPSNIIQVQLQDSVHPSVSLTVRADTICKGGLAVFTASVSNAGNQPTYQWFINGASTDSTGSQFSSTSLGNGDSITCLVTADPSSACLQSPSVVSRPIGIYVKNQSAPSITITASKNPICQGDSIQFAASSENAGTAPAYSWYLDGLSTGAGTPLYEGVHLQNGDQVSCRIIPGGGACAAGIDSSNTILVQVNDTPFITLQPADTVIHSGATVAFRTQIGGNISAIQWTPSYLLTNPGATDPVTFPLTQNTAFSLSVTSSLGCQAVATALVKIFVPLAMPSAFTPNGDGLNDLFRIPPAATIDLEEFSIYNRWGSLVFTTRNSADGWDGNFQGKKQEAGTYVYYIRGSTVKGPVLLKGTFLLIR